MLYSLVECVSVMINSHFCESDLSSDFRFCAHVLCPFCSVLIFIMFLLFGSLVIGHLGRDWKVSGLGLGVVSHTVSIRGTSQRSLCDGHF